MFLGRVGKKTTFSNESTYNKGFCIIIERRTTSPKLSFTRLVWIEICSKHNVKYGLDEKLKNLWCLDPWHRFEAGVNEIGVWSFQSTFLYHNSIISLAQTIKILQLRMLWSAKLQCESKQSPTDDHLKTFQNATKKSKYQNMRNSTHVRCDGIKSAEKSTKKTNNKTTQTVWKYTMNNKMLSIRI